jgi:hypothetical protein
VITAYEDGYVYIHDPDQYFDAEYVGVISRVHIPIPEHQFTKISRWGSDRLSASVIVYPD